LIFYKPSRPGGGKIGGECARRLKENLLGTVIMHNVVSVDGFIADENDDVGPLHE
jgi:hypothetical protein